MKPRHIAFNCRCSAEWALKKRKRPYEGYRKTFEKILEIISMQIKKNIPISTFYLMPVTVQEPDDYSLMVDEISAFLIELVKNDKIHKNKVRVSVLGKWYGLPSRMIESIKKIIDDTREYDSFFVNFCIGYDGQEEIVDAAKMIARRVKLGKIDPEAITKDTIKDDLYSSYFMPPDVIFISGKENKLKGFLLWDSVNSKLVFLNKDFAEVKIKDIEKNLTFLK